MKFAVFFSVHVALQCSVKSNDNSLFQMISECYGGSNASEEDGVDATTYADGQYVSTAIVSVSSMIFRFRLRWQQVQNFMFDLTQIYVFI